MLTSILRVGLVICLLCTYRVAQAQDEELSRGELLSVLQDLTPDYSEYALPSTFSFPADARQSSIFGIDASHHNEDHCKCKIDWPSVANSKVRFVYLKASQGSNYTDPTWLRNAKAIRSATNMDLGIYHFVSAGDNINGQISRILSEYRRYAGQTLVPAIDIEWDAGPLTAKCPSDAVIVVTKTNGDKRSYCDYWSNVRADEIIQRLNRLIDALRAETGKAPVVYTSARWWQPRVGDSRFAMLHPAKLWLADWSKSGLATEKPKKISDTTWQIWQFTNAASITSLKRISLDASILSTTVDEFRRDIALKARDGS